jgi:hypothetical protein
MMVCAKLAEQGFVLPIATMEQTLEALTVTPASPDTDLVERLLVEAYERGWREGCETLIEDYPDAEAPHKDTMGEGCGTFMGEIYPRIEALTAAAAPPSTPMAPAIDVGYGLGVDLPQPKPTPEDISERERNFIECEECGRTHDRRQACLVTAPPSDSDRCDQCGKVSGHHPACVIASDSDAKGGGA